MLSVGKDVVETTFRTLHDCGVGRFECVVYWTGPADDSSVDGVEHPMHKRSPFGYEIDDSWLTEFWKKLATTRRSVKAQVHTHPGRAFHSATDDEWPIVSQPGFLSLVIPRFAAGERSLEHAWIGQLGVDGEWREVPAARDVLVLE